MPATEALVDQKSMENSEAVAKASAGRLRVPSLSEMKAVRDHVAPYANKFMISVMKNNMVKLAYCVEYSEDSEPKFVDAFIGSIADIASLHQLLSQLLTSFQQQQQEMIRQAQGKVNPEFLERMKAMQEEQAKVPANDEGKK